MLLLGPEPTILLILCRRKEIRPKIRNSERQCSQLAECSAAYSKVSGRKNPRPNLEPSFFHEMAKRDRVLKVV